ncbi:MAG: hypothetical protein AB7I33_07075 [Gemmatimonadales bacterium]
MSRGAIPFIPALAGLLAIMAAPRPVVAQAPVVPDSVLVERLVTLRAERRALRFQFDPSSPQMRLMDDRIATLAGTVDSLRAVRARRLERLQAESGAIHHGHRNDDSAVASFERAVERARHSFCIVAADDARCRDSTGERSGGR